MPAVEYPAILPSVIEDDSRGGRHLDPFSLLLKERIIVLGTPITDFAADIVIAQMLYLEREDQTKDINLYIQSPGGGISAGLAIYDTIQLARCDVSTLCMGSCANMATILLAAGTAGKRYALPHATIHLHQVYGGASGQAVDIEIQAREILRRNEVLKNILAAHTGQSPERIAQDWNRDLFLDPKQAKEYGIIDEILTKRSS